MQTQRIPMSIEQFHALPNKFGWKHEYYDGCAHISPREWCAIASMPVQPRRAQSPLPLRPVTKADIPELMTGFAECFEDNVEYCDYDEELFARSTRNCIHGFFDGRRGRPLPASFVATAPATPDSPERIAGAALVVQDAVSPYLRLLFVRPHWQRQGLATALVAQVMNALDALGETQLASGYHLANEASIAWHARFGFTEEPDWMLAQFYCNHARSELHWREEQGELTDTERTRLEQDCRMWEARLEELDALRKREGLDAVSPLHRRRTGSPSEAK